MAIRLKNAVFAAPALLFAALAAPLPAWAQTASPTPAAPSAGRPMNRVLPSRYRPLALQLRGLNLTPEQRQQLAGILKAHQPEIKAVHEKLRAARAAWKQSGKIDIEQRKSLNQERMAVLQAVRTEILNVLTPEQKAQIEARRQRRKVR